MMSRKTILFSLVALAVTWAVLPVGAESPSESDQAEPDQETSTSANTTEKDPKLAEKRAVSAPPPGMPVYKPPMLSKPTRTVGGGSRGVGDTAPAVYAIVPNHVAQSASRQPSLFWYLDGLPSGSAKIEFTLIDDEADTPLVEKTLTAPKSAGLQRIRLSDFGARLESGTEYQWSIAMSTPGTDHSKDVISFGWIDYVGRSEGVAARLAADDADRSAFIYADEGIWYDALTSIDDSIERDSGAANFKVARASLLEEAGLGAVALRVRD